MSSTIHHKGNGRHHHPDVQSGVNRLEEQFAEMSLSEASAAIGFSRLPAALSGPVQEVAHDLRVTLRDFIQQHPISDALMGFDRNGPDPVPVAPLLGKLSAWESRLESVIQSQRSLPTELCPLRLFAIGLQSNVEMFALVLRSSASEGEVAASQLPHVIEQAINLKAEAGILMAKMDSISFGETPLQ